MFDCLTYVNHTLGNDLMDIIYELSMSLDDFLDVDVLDTTGFLYDMLSPPENSI
jgi:hypothetical protein